MDNLKKDRELELIHFLPYHLMDDISGMKVKVLFQQTSLRQPDALLSLLNNLVIARPRGDQLYNTARVGPWSNPSANVSRTPDAMQSPGGLITHTKASNLIIGYHDKFSPVRILEQNYDLKFDKDKRAASKSSILRAQEGRQKQLRI